MVERRIWNGNCKITETYLNFVLQSDLNLSTGYSPLKKMENLQNCNISFTLKILWDWSKYFWTAISGGNCLDCPHQDSQNCTKLNILLHHHNTSDSYLSQGSTCNQNSRCKCDLASLRSKYIVYILIYNI